MRPLDFAIAGTFVVVVIGAVLYATLVDGGRPDADLAISLSVLASDLEEPARESAPPGLRFAVAAVLSPSAMLDEYEALEGYLEDRLARPVELVRGKGYAEINALVRSRDVALALVCSGAFVLGRRDFGMQALVVPVVNGAATYRSYLIVGSSSDIATWDDLRGKTFAFTDPLSNSGRLVPVYMLVEMGESPEEFFDRFIFTYAHDRSVNAVALGLVDAAAVDSLVYDQMVLRDPLVASATRVIWESPPYGINPIVVHPDADPGLKRELEELFLGMAEDPEGQVVLALLGIDSFAMPDPGGYETIEQMIEATAGW